MCCLTGNRLRTKGDAGFGVWNVGCRQTKCSLVDIWVGRHGGFECEHSDLNKSIHIRILENTIEYEYS
jgi:hypothetical protein